MPSSSAVVNAVGILLMTIGVEGDWVFTWPYGSDGSCRCEAKDFGLRTFLTEEKCLEAFSESEYEYCSWNGGSPLVEKQCDFAISTTTGFHNSYCVGKCSEVVSGLLTINEYMKECDLEVVVDFDYAVATLPTGCYSNLVFGYSDYNPSSAVQHPPLRFFDKVSTASRCQELCQDVDGCAAFVWRAVPDHDSTSSFQNDPLTCILYDENFMKHVTEDQIPSSFGTPTEYCDVPAVGECASISFPRPSWNILEDQTCLTCGCEPRCIYYSDSHITGPAFCNKQADRTPQDLCDYIRPSWTTPEPECPTETCVVEPPSTTSTEGVDNTDEGTSVTHVALTTEPSKGSTTTAPATQPEAQTSTIPDLTQMTAQSDTALTTTAAAETTTTTTFPVQPSATPAGTQEESSETATTVRLETTQQPTTEETTTDVLLETTTSSSPATGQSSSAPATGQSSSAPATGQSSSAPATGQSSSAPSTGQSSSAPAIGQSSSAPDARASTTSTTVPATPGASSKTSPGGCVPGCPDCPCFKESDCDDCYSISDCMDEEC